jgi:hypothetical protein
VSLRAVLRYGDLGALALLADIPSGAARDNVDVGAIARLARKPADLETLDGLLRPRFPAPGR